MEQTAGKERMGKAENHPGFQISQARISQVEEILKVYDRARRFMADHGNPTQWPPDYPDRDLIEDDIKAGHLFLCMAGDEIGAVFYYRVGEEPDYEQIREGSWLDEEPYGVVHRIASQGRQKGAGRFCLDWAFEQCGNIRIDTHRDNVVMQNLLRKSGFQYCGLITGRDGGERLAYQKNEKTVAM